MRERDHIITYTIVYVEDKEINNCVAFIAEFPGAISEGFNKNEAKEALIEKLKFLIDSTCPDEEIENLEPDKVNISHEKIEFKLI